MHAFSYAAPATLQEAIHLLTQHPEGAKLMNGGTDVVTQLRDRLISPDLVIDIKRIPGLCNLTFSPEDGLFIGSTVTMNALAAHPAVAEHYPFLAQSAHSVGSKQVRNRATCAGNLVNASPLADTATPLLCCDAVVLCAGPNGTREIPLTDFFIFVRKTALQRDEIVTGLRVPYVPGQKGVFTKISRRREVDLSTICGTVVRQPGGWRVAFGAVAPTPRRLPKTEAFLDATPLTQETIEAAAALAQTEVSPIDDVRASRAYRLEVVGVTLRRSLTALAEEGTL